MTLIESNFFEGGQKVILPCTRDNKGPLYYLEMGWKRLLGTSKIGIKNFARPLRESLENDFALHLQGQRVHTVFFELKEIIF